MEKNIANLGLEKIKAKILTILVGITVLVNIVKVIVCINIQKKK
jgi:hypothetical protein